ncbi:MAG: hypothetical protein H6R26_69 [Proteobacteria bacterium]|nr:hypothetical protein [Pseudomonadota bacterium]
MAPDPNEVMPFRVKDCALLAIATGRRAQNLKELRDHLLTTHPGSIYYHFWGGLLHPRFEEREYNNDFAAWAHYAVHDKVLAERLSVMDPTAYASLDDLRLELIEVIEARLDEREVLSWAQPDQQFAFIRSQIVVFDTGRQMSTPEDLASQLPELSVSSVFYHFIDARRRSENRRDDFSNWLASFGDAYAAPCQLLETVDTYFTSLSDLRTELANGMANCLCQVGHE